MGITKLFLRFIAETVKTQIKNNLFNFIKMKLGVRESQVDDLEKIVDYFLQAKANFLHGMGADKSRLPKKEAWLQALQGEITKPYQDKNYYYIIWLVDNEAVGHSNVNHIKFGESATMHLHLWNNKQRKRGLGLSFLKMTIPYYFKNLALKKVICEPYSKNSGPNKILKKFGFDLVRTYETIPGPINFRQIVHRYELTRGRLEELF